ncbi:hypothetical protein LUW74_06835 [Actinomadura madurae]|nr:hypothetical protein [Actinomadura madurae]URN03089.1 hypothetical protein LUW74_06835 [Actinomadura madurae]
MAGFDDFDGQALRITEVGDMASPVGARGDQHRGGAAGTGSQGGQPGELGGEVVGDQAEMRGSGVPGLDVDRGSGGFEVLDQLQPDVAARDAEDRDVQARARIADLVGGVRRVVDSPDIRGAPNNRS